MKEYVVFYTTANGKEIRYVKADSFASARKKIKEQFKDEIIINLVVEKGFRKIRLKLLTECKLTKEQYEEIKNAIMFQDNEELGLYMYYGQKGNYKVKFSEDAITVLEVWEGIIW